MEKLTRDNLESMLDSGRMEAAIRMGAGKPDRWWRLRRNGATKRWKRDPDRFEIPVKAGLRATTRITDADVLPDGTINPSFFRLATEA